ncbi:MAG: YdcF family protein [Flavobacteriales bacterium]|nr:YdcF family protein [Flavobacteriales bacterium]
MQLNKHILSKPGLWALITILLPVVFVFWADWRVTSSAVGKTFTDSESLPENKVGLLLGTGKILGNGHINLYYKYRIDAAVQLYESGKIHYVLISGDNSKSYYDEPTTMKRDLIKRGVPSDKIYLDYAGFRTLDSVVRAREIFGQESITVISQRFHNQRAIYIADSKGMQAVGYNAQDVTAGYGFKVMVREKLARAKMYLDLIFGIKPKFLGKKIVIK